MMHIGIVLAAVVLLAPAAWAEDAPVPEADGASATSTTRPERRVYGGRAGEPANLPTGLPGFGTPGPPPPAPDEKDAPPKQ